MFLCCKVFEIVKWDQVPCEQSFLSGMLFTLYVACVAWRFCRAGHRSGVAAKFAREARENERRSPEKNKNQSPRGFSALARLYYLARPTKTAMLRRLLCTRRSCGRHSRRLACLRSNLLRAYCNFESQQAISITRFVFLVYSSSSQL